MATNIRIYYITLLKHADYRVRHYAKWVNNDKLRDLLSFENLYVS